MNKNFAINLNSIKSLNLPNPTVVTSLIADSLPNLAEQKELVTTLLEDSLPNLAEQKELVTTLLEDSLPNLAEQKELVTTLLEESLPTLAEQKELVTTLLEESISNIMEPPELANTLLDSLSTLSEQQEVANTLIVDSLSTLSEHQEVANTLIDDSLSTLAEQQELANTLIADSLPTLAEQQQVVNTLIADSLPTLAEQKELATTLLTESLPTLSVHKIINVESVINPAIRSFVEDVPYKKSTLFKRPTLQIQLPTFNSSKITVPTHVELPPISEIDLTEKKNKDKETNQDSKQKMAVVATLVLELYRMLTSSLLILFVPQSCKGQLCTISNNVKWNPRHHQYNFGICVNFITLFIYTALYYIELKRENRLIKYLDVNPDMPSSNEAVETTLQNISLEKKQKILAIDKYYQRISYISFGMYVFNSIVSGVIISHYYLGTQTTTTFITSLLFMFTKLLNVYQVANTDEHIFYSGYMKTFVQFNDLDNSHKNPDNL